jgi:hypothetical protein
MAFFNVFKLRKWAALLLTGLLTVISFFIGLKYYGFWLGLAAMGGGLLFSVLLSCLLLKNPFTDMLEGKGILALNIDSTGVIKPFIVSVQQPYIIGWLNKTWIKGIFDRALVFNMAVPTKTKTPAKLNPGCKDKGIALVLDEDEYNRARFGFFHYPVLIYNQNVQSFVTKDFLSDTEKTTFAEYLALYLNRKMEELTSAVRDFGRHVVELSKPQGSILQNKWFWIIMVIGMVILGIMFAPSIYNAVVNTMHGAGGALNLENTITPR